MCFMGYSICSCKYIEDRGKMQKIKLLTRVVFSELKESLLEDLNKLTGLMQKCQKFLMS